MPPPDPGNENAQLREQLSVEIDVGSEPRIDHTADGLRAQYLLLRNATADRRLSASHLACLAVIVDHYSRRSGTAFPGFLRMARLTGLHRSTVMRAIGDLEHFGWITVDRSHRHANVYRIAQWPESRDWPTSSAHDTGRTRATSSKRAQEVVAPTHTGSSVDARRVVAQMRPQPAFEPALEPASKQPTQESLASLAAGASNRFDEFWKAYPRKENKKKAAAIWKSRKLDCIADQIVKAVRDRAARDPKWKDRKFVPMPTTFLIGDRWLDEWGRNDSYGSPQRKPSVTDTFIGKKYVGTPIDELPEFLRP